MTAPWQPRAADALRRDLAKLCTVSVYTPGGETVPLEVEGSASVTFDEGWAPHVQASFVTSLVDVDQLNRLDPRLGVRLRIEAGYRYAAGQRDVHQLADLRLLSRLPRRPHNLMPLDAASDEGLLQDTTPLGASRTWGVNTLVRDAMVELITWLLDPDPVVVVTATDTTTTLGQVVTLSTGADLWGQLMDWADRIDAWVYVDGNRVWNVADRPSLVGQAAYRMETGPAGNVEASESALDLADWGNAVLVQYPGGLFGYAYADTGPYRITAVPLKVVKVRRDVLPPGAAAQQLVADNILARVMSRGRGMVLEGPAAFWLRPGHTVTVQLPAGPMERHLVSRVTFDLQTGRMTVRTRVPDNDTLTLTGA